MASELILGAIIVTEEATSGDRPTSPNQCLHHSDRSAEFVCSVCTRYFCEECVSERYYPRFAYICHHCSGEKPYEAPPQPVKAEPEPEPEPQESWLAPIRARLVLSVELLVLVLCVAFVGFQVSRLGEPEEEELVLESSSPEDLAIYCIGRLDQMEYLGVAATEQQIRNACPDPLQVSNQGTWVQVSSPDAEEYGFAQIEVTLNPVGLTITE